jgi:L-asparaginase II
MIPEIFCTKSRNGLDEAIYRGHAVAIDDRFNIISQVGDPGYVTFFRSSSKPLQAMLVMLSGAYKKYGLDLSHLAIASGSHNGQAVHTEVVSDLLSKVGLDENFLHCGVHPPLTKAARTEFDENTAKQINHNCSGKHAGMLATCMAMGWSTDNYWMIDHPVQQWTLDVVSRMCNVGKKDVIIGIDGCGVPVFGMPIFNMSVGFSKLSKPDLAPDELKESANLVSEAVKKYPILMGGEDRVITAFLEDNPDFVAKDGAEAVFCAGKDGKAFTFKLESGDGTEPFRFVIARLSLTLGGKVDKLNPFYDIPILSTHGDQVGQLDMITNWKPW